MVTAISGSRRQTTANWQLSVNGANGPLTCYKLLTQAAAYKIARLLANTGFTGVVAQNRVSGQVKYFSPLS